MWWDRMGNQVEQTYDIMEVCLLAGKIMLQSGAETYRVEDTMMRIASSFGIVKTHSYVTPTGIIFQRKVQSRQRLSWFEFRSALRIWKRWLWLIVFREISAAVQLIANRHWSNWMRLIRWTFPFPLVLKWPPQLCSGCLWLCLKAAGMTLFPRWFRGLGYLSFVCFHRFIPIKFFSEFWHPSSLVCCRLFLWKWV